MSDSLIMSMYEEGRSVKEIAKAMGTAPSDVHDLLAKRDQTQTVQVARQEKHVRDLRRVRALADGMTQKYLETLNAVIDDPDSTVDEKKTAFGEMDKVIRISKLSSDRVLRHPTPRKAAPCCNTEEACKPIFANIGVGEILTHLRSFYTHIDFESKPIFIYYFLQH